MAQTIVIACLAIAGAWLLIGLLAAASAVAWWRVDLDIELYRWTIVCLAIVSEFLAPACVYVMGLPGRYMSRQVAGAALVIACCAFNVVGSYHAATGFLAEISSTARAEQRRVLVEEIASVTLLLREASDDLRASRPDPNAPLGPKARAEAKKVYDQEVARLGPEQRDLRARLQKLERAHAATLVADTPWWLPLALIALEVVKLFAPYAVAMETRSKHPGLAAVSLDVLPSPIGAAHAPSPEHGSAASWAADDRFGWFRHTATSILARVALGAPARRDAVEMHTVPEREPLKDSPALQAGGPPTVEPIPVRPQLLPVPHGGDDDHQLDASHLTEATVTSAPSDKPPFGASRSRVSPEQHDLMVRLRTEGHVLREIASVIGFSHETVRRHVSGVHRGNTTLREEV